MGGRRLGMTVVDRQIHGYRQGHQLLAASRQLPKEDQSVIDRLSDVAGPLRPREHFSPYLTAYPLPSGERFVLARTWQDVTVPRAGCVRTLSLVIPVAEWATAEDPSYFVDLLSLDRLPDELDATDVAVCRSPPRPLPAADSFGGSELLEALFLEESRPVVVLDAPAPELIAIRLITALWPALRRRFAISTFARSPRKVAGRDFDLVFAPKDARAKFSDWNGRRIDGRSSQSERHRWTGSIVGRVFDNPFPRLLTDAEIGLVGGETDDADNAAALRIALLWDELVAKLGRTPTAALGLLDIANSGKVRDEFAIRMLEPTLADAVLRAPILLPEDEAWTFLSAIARKIHGRAMIRGSEAVDEAVGELTGRSPEGAIALLSEPDDRGALTRLPQIIGDRIGATLDARAEHALLNAEPVVLGRLVSSSSRLAEGVASDVHLLERVGEIFSDLDPSLAGEMSEELLPHLVSDWQIPAAAPLLQRLDERQLAREIRHLGNANDFEGHGLADLCISRAREIGAKNSVLNVLSQMPGTDRRNALLAQTLDPTALDAVWLLRNSGLPEEMAVPIFSELLERADDRQLAAILTDPNIGTDAIRIAKGAGPDLIRRVIFIDAVPLDVFVRVLETVIAVTSGEMRSKISLRALQRCFGSHFGGDEAGFLTAMLGGVGERLDGSWAARAGLGTGIRAPLASRNMIALRNTPQPARTRVIQAVGDLGLSLRERGSFDLDWAASEACVQLLLEAEKAAPRAALAAAGHLLPMLMRQRKDPVSPLIAASFPLIYRELAKKDDVPELLKFVPFFDWDRCKAARQELVSAFMSSSWAPGDLALTAWRCNDLGKILRRTAKAYGGDRYISKVEADLARLPDSCRRSAAQTIASIRSDWSSKFDWRD